jgi:hypothetical protein
MLKHRTIGTAVVIALWLILGSVPSQAASWTGSQLLGPASGILTKIERWWIALVNGPERPSSPQPPAGQKNGCGMDPQGKPQCEPGGGQGTTTVPGVPAGPG